MIDAKGIADISLATTAPRTAAKNNFSPNPIDPTPGAGNGIFRILNYFKATYGVKKAAIFYQDVATGVNQSKNYEIDFEKAGIPVVAKYPVAATATNFRSQATDMKEKGVDIVITVAEVGAISNLARAFKDVGYLPKVPFYGAQTYGKKFLQQAGAAANGTKIGLIFDVPEETGGAAHQGVRRLVQAHRAGRRPRLLRHPELGGRRHVRRRAAGRRTRPHPGQDRSPRCGRSPNYTGDGHRRADQPGPEGAAEVLPRPRGEGRQVGEDLPGQGLPVLTSLVDRLRGDRQMLVNVVVGSAAAVLAARCGPTTGPARMSSFLEFTLIGISSGCVFAIAASGLVLTYTTTGVFNFAHGAVGMVSAFLFYQLRTRDRAAGAARPPARARDRAPR